MAITLTDYNKWLQNPEADRVLLCEITVYNGSSDETLYFSSKTFQSLPTDAIEKQFLPLLIGNPSISRSIPFFENGRGDDDFGTISISNADTELDYLQSYQFRGRAIRLLLGDESWTSYDDFNVKPLLEGVIAAKPTFTDTEITFNVTDILGKLNIPIQENLLGSGSDNEDKPRPLCYGTPSNISPVLIDNSTHKYKFNDGQVDSITTLYEKGYVTTAFTSDLVNGELTMTSRPGGTITADVKGIKPSGSHLKLIGDIARDIICRFGPFTDPDDLDTASFSALNTAKPFNLSYYITDKMNILDVLDDLFSSVGGFYLSDFDGKITVGYIKDPALEASVLDIDSDKAEIELAGFSVEPFNVIQWRTKLNYNKNWTVQKDSDLAGIITDPGYPNASRVDFLMNQWRTVKYENTGIVPGGNYHFVNDPEAIDTYIDSKADALTEATYRQGILEKQRYYCNFTAKTSLFGVLPGDIINITDSRYGLENGKNMQILQINYIALENKAEVKAWY